MQIISCSSFNYTRNSGGARVHVAGTLPLHSCGPCVQNSQHIISKLLRIRMQSTQVNTHKPQHNSALARSLLSGHVPNVERQAVCLAVTVPQCVPATWCGGSACPATMYKNDDLCCLTSLWYVLAPARKCREHMNMHRARASFVRTWSLRHAYSIEQEWTRTRGSRSDWAFCMPEIQLYYIAPR